ncbi:uncharacterized protein LOC108863863 [Galendromus occidentalis]|uniref:Uncharacterized protein LOC108863863 n=1 Tax=Galendromus occidentalis TaxID=34638 RepID=A0AAJ7L531_9ACAR|nr:uncharacterized protein LOC108863863 [Galendromus occidentalis]
MLSEFPYEIYGTTVPDPRHLPQREILKYFDRPHDSGRLNASKLSRPIVLRSQVNAFDPTKYRSETVQRPAVGPDGVDSRARTLTSSRRAVPDAEHVGRQPQVTERRAGVPQTTHPDAEHVGWRPQESERRASVPHTAPAPTSRPKATVMNVHNIHKNDPGMSDCDD